MTAAPAYDVVIAGGGPAGCSAAISLAQAGARVAVYEARAYPHDKVCGEFLSPECAGLLAQLGLPDALAALGAVPIHRAHLAAPGGAVWETALPGPAWGLSRKALDAALSGHAQAAGADVHSGVTVTRIEGDLEAGFALTLQTRGQERVVRARVVIAAHGKRSSLDRAVGRSFLNRRQPYVALKAHYQGPALPGRLELHMFDGGYCGLTEIEDGAANICLLVRTEIFRAAAGTGPGATGRFITWLRGQDGWLDAWLGRANRLDDDWLSIAQVPFTAKDMIHNDVLMAGDAAGLVAPLVGDGIAMALAGGQLAAHGVQAYLQGSWPAAAFRRGYRARWRREFSPRLRLGRLLQPLLMHPATAGLGLRLLTLAPGIGQALVRRTRDLAPLAGAGSPQRS